MSLRRKIVIASLDDAKKVIEDLNDRVELLEKIVKQVYHTQAKGSRAVSSALHDTGVNLTNANRQIAKISKG